MDAIYNFDVTSTAWSEVTIPEARRDTDLEMHLIGGGEFYVSLVPSGAPYAHVFGSYSRRCVYRRAPRAITLFVKTLSGAAKLAVVLA